MRDAGSGRVGWDAWAPDVGQGCDGSYVWVQTWKPSGP